MAISIATKYDDKGKVIEREDSYVGCVLDTGELNFYDDSDFYAVVWDEKEQKVKRVEYATTRASTYDNYAEVDATPEIIAKATAKLREIWVTILTHQALELSCKPDIGKRVVAHTEKGKFEGTFEGVIFWKREYKSQYGTWSRGWRYGVKCDDGETRFYNEENVKVIDPTEYYQPPTDYQINTISNNPRAATSSQGLVFV